MIFAPAINTATAGVRREDSGVASALVNTMQQVGGSIGTSVLSTIALTATASYLAAHPASALRLDTETKLITHAIRMAAYNAETILARALDGCYSRTGDEAYALIREALTTSGDIIPDGQTLHVRLDPLTAPRRTRALACLCDQLNATRTIFPGTKLTLRYAVKEHQSTT